MGVLSGPGAAARRAAGRGGAIGPVEKSAMTGKAVENGRVETATVSAQHAAQIVGHDIDYIGSGHSCSCGREGRSSGNSIINPIKAMISS